MTFLRTATVTTVLIALSYSLSSAGSLKPAWSTNSDWSNNSADSSSAKEPVTSSGPVVSVEPDKALEPVKPPNVAKTNTGTLITGVNIAYAPDYLGSNEYKFGPLPFGVFTFSGSRRYIELNGLQLSVNLFDIPNLSAGPVFSVDGSRGDGVKDEVVKKMSKISSAFDFGAFVTYDIPEKNPRNKVSLSLKVLDEVSGKKKGYTADFTTSYSQQVSSKVDMKIGASATFADKKHMDTYFSVNSGNRGSATVIELPDHSAGSSLRNVGVQLGTTRYHDKNWIFGGVLSFQQLLGDAKNSPIVSIRGSENQLATVIYAAYLW